MADPPLHGIPTLYRDVQYRSRLEARWAAFFDLLGWKHQYEPFDLAGWVPDFLLFSAPKILVEVKPVVAPPLDVVGKIGRSGVPAEYEVMIVGCVVPVEDHSVDSSDGHPIGWLRCNPAPWRPENTPAWGSAVVQVFEDDVARGLGFDSRRHFGLYSSLDHRQRCNRGHQPSNDELCNFVQDRFAPGGTDLVFWGVGAIGTSAVASLWHQAGNLVQWRGHRSVTR